MDLGIAGRVALVAGASRGMGRASAELLAAEGCRVGLVARGKADLEAVAEEIAAAGGEAVPVVADLGEPEGVRTAVEAVTAAYGEPEIVVGQNSDGTLGGFDDTTDDDYERVFRAFTMSQVYLARATVGAMKRKGWGRYIHIGSANGKEPQLSHPHIVHNCVRPSTVAFLRVLAEELAPHGTTVNVVGPGLTATSALAYYIEHEMRLTTEQGADWLAGRPVEGIQGGQGPVGLPMGRAAQPREIGAVVTFLASELAGYLTGEFIAVDGGRHRFAF
ncbi:SDR family oxidoreductase [Streptomyces sp. NPDC004044]|uniref:SDR family oxidoreductase n=1 Tax=Streptomyces sp. NPDC005356 TaxID=3157167 RepID=UPI0033ADF2F7